jgi:hypothetical protein
MLTAIGSGHNDIRPGYAAELALAGDAAALVERLNRLLCAGQLSEATRSLITTTITGMPGSGTTDKTQRVQAAVMLVMASPDYLVQR